MTGEVDMSRFQPLYRDVWGPAELKPALAIALLANARPVKERSGICGKPPNPGTVRPNRGGGELQRSGNRACPI